MRISGRDSPCLPVIVFSLVYYRPRFKKFVTSLFLDLPESSEHHRKEETLALLEMLFLIEKIVGIVMISFVKDQVSLTSYSSVYGLPALN